MLLVKLIEPPCTERYARWCERSGNHSDFPPTRSQIFHHLHTYRVLEVAREREVPFQATRLETKEEAQNAPTPVTTYALFYNGEYLTNEQMNDKRFIKLLDGMEK